MNKQLIPISCKYWDGAVSSTFQVTVNVMLMKQARRKD